MSSLRDPVVASVLDELHRESRRDIPRFAMLIPRYLLGRALGRSMTRIIPPETMKDFYIPVDPEQGQLLYHMARAINAKTIVEFGTSFGISTIYLAAALRDNDGRVVVGSEMVESKVEQANANLERAGLSEYCDIRVGDAVETLEQLPGPVDMFFLDGWKDLYLPLLQRMRPNLRAGAVVIADNIYSFKKELKPYVDYVQSGENGFESCTLPFSHGFEFSVYTGD